MEANRVLGGAARCVAPPLRWLRFARLLRASAPLGGIRALLSFPSLRSPRASLPPLPGSVGRGCRALLSPPGRPFPRSFVGGPPGRGRRRPSGALLARSARCGRCAGRRLPGPASLPRPAVVLGGSAAPFFPSLCSAIVVDRSGSPLWPPPPPIDTPSDKSERKKMPLSARFLRFARFSFRIHRLSEVESGYHSDVVPV